MIANHLFDHRKKTDEIIYFDDTVWMALYI